jgi:hypothetical protein
VFKTEKGWCPKVLRELKRQKKTIPNVFASHLEEAQDHAEADGHNNK